MGIEIFAFSFTDVYIGGHFGHFLESKIKVLGGVALIGAGINILLEDLRLA